MYLWISSLVHRVMAPVAAYNLTTNDSLTNTHFLNFYVAVLIVNLSALRIDSN